MKITLTKCLIWCLVACTVLLVGGPAGSQVATTSNTPADKPASPPPAAYATTPITIGQVVAALESDLTKLESALRVKLETLESVQQSFNAGLVTAINLTQAKEEAAQANSAVVEAQTRLQMAKRLLLLTRPVDVYFKDTSLVQAVESLSKASGLKITSAPVPVVTPTLPGSAQPDQSPARLSVNAQGVPLSAVLETVAQTWGLLIAPDGNDAVVLKPLPVLQVNGQPRPVALPNYTWSDEWGIPPTYSGTGFGWNPMSANKGFSMWPSGGPFGQTAMPQPGVMPGGGDTSPKGNSATTKLPMPGVSQGNTPIGSMNIPKLDSGAFGPVMPFPYGIPSQGTPVAMSMAMARDRLDRLILVVADPVSGMGSTGYWLTPYELKSDTGEIKRIGSSKFHPNSGIAQKRAEVMNGSSAQVTVMVYLKNAVADSVVWNLTHRKGTLPIGVRVQPDVKKNAVSITGAPLDVYTATQTIERLDKDNAKRIPVQKKVKP